MDDRPDEDDAVLIAYVRGRLSGDAADRIAARAAEQPELAAEIALTRGIVAAVDEEARGPAPGELGWARLSRALEAEPRQAPARPRSPIWRLAAVAAAAVLVWQVAAVPFLTAPQAPPAGYAPVAEQPAADITLTVAFAPSATEEAIRTLLQRLDARISDGPSAIGLWEISFETAAARDGALAELQDADIVESAQIE